MSSSLLPDPASLAVNARNSQLLQKEVELRGLQGKVNKGQAEDAKLREAAKGFESIFITKLWQQMRATVPKDGYLHSKEEDMYLSMFDQEMANKLADAGGIGLGQMLYEQLSQSMNDASRVTSPSRHEARLPLKPLRGYDPALLNPPEHRDKSMEAEAVKEEQESTPKEPLASGDMDDLYAPMEGYSDQSGQPGQEGQAGEQQPQESVAGAENASNFNMGAPLRLEPEPEPTAIPSSAEELAEIKADANTIQVEPEILAAVEALARRIAPYASPATKEYSKTSLRSPVEATQAQNYHPRGRLIQQPVIPVLDSETPEAADKADGLTPLLEGQARNAAAPVEKVEGVDAVERLEQGIRNSGGAAQNTGGPMVASPNENPDTAGVSPVAPGDEKAPTAPIQWPVAGRLTSEFGWRRSPFTGQRSFHAGVDLAANFGDPVKSCWDGKVIFSGDKQGYGKLVIVEHEGGWQSYYGHNSKLDVQVGDEIKAGQDIAKVGSTGLSTGPHVHFELRRNGTALDPLKVQQSLMAGISLDHAV